jgi:hypothetical protein
VLLVGNPSISVGKRLVAIGRITEAQRLHLIHCENCSDEAHRIIKLQSLCLPSHDPLEQGMCFNKDCYNYGTVRSGAYDC